MKQSLCAMAVALLLTTLNSCSSGFHMSTSSARIRNVNETSIRETPGIADLKVEEQKVTGTSTGTGVSDESAKNLAVYDALKKVSADVLVEPNYDIDHVGSTTTVNVSGYPGFYKNFRKPTSQDSIIMGWKIPVVPVTVPQFNNNSGNTSVNITTSNVTLQQAGQGYIQPAPVLNNPNPNFINRAYNTIASKPMAKDATANYDTEAYKKEKRKANNFLGWGITLLLTGVIIDGCSPLGNAWDNYDPADQQYDASDPAGEYAMLGVGTALVVVGCALIPVGAGHLRKAKQIKSAGFAENMNLSIVPNFNVASNRYGATLALKF